MQPKAFVSHSSADKERFVLGFARRLMAQSINAWVDKWEMKPGDSLVKKIWDEVIAEADAFIVVLSRDSVASKWVREELDAAVIKRISDSTRIIPVVIDNCDIPLSLKPTVYVSIRDVTSYDAELSRIVSTIYGSNDKPAIGLPPGYVSVLVDRMPGLGRLDTYLLKTGCERAIEGNTLLGAPGLLVDAALALDVGEDEARESMHVLEHLGYLKLSHEAGGGILLFSITHVGFESYAQSYIEDYALKQRLIMAELLNSTPGSSYEIVTRLALPRLLVEHVLSSLASQGYLTLYQAMGGGALISNVSPALRRLLTE